MTIVSAVGEEATPQLPVLRKWLAILSALVLSAGLGFVLLGQRSVVALDYRAFYCAGMALRHHANPYHTDVLRQCEKQETDAQYSERLKNVALPAPQPLYDVAFFSLLSLVPFELSKAIWGALLGIATLLTTYSLIRLTGISAPLVFAILGLSIVADSLALGQMIPLYTAAACLAALLARQNQLEWAGAVGSITLLEPHLGLPICISLAVWAPRSRIQLLGGAGALAIIAFAAGGLATNVEYISTVLPLHALSEISSDKQLSLSAILAAMGVKDATAVQLGTLSYFAMSSCGILAGRALSLRLNNYAFLVAVPAATAVIGGSFLHATEIVAAVPLALLLVSSNTNRVAVGALVLLTIPWSGESHPAELLWWFLFASLVSGYVVWACGRASVAFSAACAAFIFVALCYVNFSYVAEQHRYQQHSHVTTTTVNEKYPEAGWARINKASLSTQSLWSWAIRIPTWTGLALLMGCVVIAIRQQRLQVCQT